MKEIYVGTADGVWRAIYTGGPQKFYKVSYTGELRANSFFKLSADNVNVFTYDDMLVASDQGLLSSGRADGLQRLVEYYEFPHTESMAEVAGRTAFLKDDGFCTVEDGCLAVDPSGPASQTDDGVLIPAGMNLVSAYMSTEGGVELATLDVSGVESDILQVLYMGFRNDNRIIYLRTSSAVYSYDINMRVAKRIIGPVDDMKSGGMVYLRNGGTLSASVPGRETVSEYPQIMSYFRVQGYENSGVFKIIQRGGERVFVSPGKLYVLSDGRQS